MNSKPLIVLLSILLLTPVLSGCLSDDVLGDVIPQKKGRTRRTNNGLLDKLLHKNDY